jgi:hypothetical protein
VAVERLLGIFGGPAFVVQYPNGDRSQYFSAIFECTVLGGSPVPDGDEVNGVTFAGPNDIGSLRCQPWLHHVLPTLWKRPASPFF